MNYETLPPNLPVPADDGACRHLPGMRLPPIGLPTTSSRIVRLDEPRPYRVIVYCYPMTGRPGVPLPAGWDQIPGARGCTPQSCAFRDHFQELRAAGAGELYGLSTQPMDYQREAAERLHLPFELLSDSDLQFTRALRLPTFLVEGKELIRRLTLVVRAGVIEHVFYPVFPPDRHAREVMEWLHKSQSHHRN